MSKVSELVYMVTDLVKTMSDDCTINENHILYLLDIYRAFLLKQRYEKDPKKIVPESNYQVKEIPVELVEYGHAVDFCSCVGNDYCDHKERYQMLASVDSVQPLMALGIPRIYLLRGPFNYSFVRVPMSRFEVVGHNKWLSNFIYWTIGPDEKIYIKSTTNECYKSLEKIALFGIFESYRDENTNLDDDFPLEESLIPNLLELVVKDVLGAAYRPKDRDNNASDDLANLAAFIRQNMKDRYVKDTQTTSANAE